MSSYIRYSPQEQINFWGCFMNISINDNLLFAVAILVLGIVLIAILIYLGVCRRYRSIDKYIDKLFKSKTPSKSYKSYEEISNQFNSSSNFYKVVLEVLKIIIIILKNEKKE